MKKKIMIKEESDFQEMLGRIEKSKNQKFSQEQCAAIQYGYSIGADVERYASTVYNGGQMRELYEAQALGVDTALLENPDFRYDQMHEIRMGLREGLDVSVYADVSFKSQHMSWIRRAMSRGIDVREYDAFFRSTYHALKWYKLLCKSKEDIEGQPFKVKVSRIEVTEYEITVGAEDEEVLTAGLESINVLEIDNLQIIKNKLHEKGISIKESNFSKPHAKTGHIEMQYINRPTIK